MKTTKNTAKPLDPAPMKKAKELARKLVKKLRQTENDERLEDQTRLMQYIRGGSVPQATRSGWTLCHNHVRHTANTRCGVNGFRAWWVKVPPEHFVPCPCGWSGLPHFALSR